MTDQAGKQLMEKALSMLAEKDHADQTVQELLDSTAERIQKKQELYEQNKGLYNQLSEVMVSYFDSVFEDVYKEDPIPHSLDELKEKTIRQVQFAVSDPMIIAARRMIKQEQFKDSVIADLSMRHLMKSVENLYAAIFEGMMESGVMKEGDNEFLAFEYTSPITTLIHYSDVSDVSSEETMKRVTAHIDHFIEHCRPEKEVCRRLL